MAGQIAELSRRSLRDNFRSIDPTNARVLLVDAGSTILGSFPPSLQRKTAETLGRLGVEIHLAMKVTGVDARGLNTNADDTTLARIAAATKIWAAGVEASPLGRLLAEATGASVDRAGRVEVQPDCTISRHPEIFVIGDLMSLDRLPGLAPVAIQSGTHAANTIARRLRGDTSATAFHYHDRGAMATISRFRAVATVGPFRASGLVGWLLWLFVHLISLTGFKNRLAVLSSWTVAFIGRGRPQRAFTPHQPPQRQPPHNTQHQHKEPAPPAAHPTRKQAD